MGHLDLRRPSLRRRPCLPSLGRVALEPLSLPHGTPPPAPRRRPGLQGPMSDAALVETDAIIAACCDAWMRLVAETDRIKSLCSYPWIEKVASSTRRYQGTNRRRTRTSGRTVRGAPRHLSQASMIRASSLPQASQLRRLSNKDRAAALIETYRERSFHRPKTRSA